MRRPVRRAARGRAAGAVRQVNVSRNVRPGTGIAVMEANTRVLAD